VRSVQQKLKRLQEEINILRVPNIAASLKEEFAQSYPGLPYQDIINAKIARIQHGINRLSGYIAQQPK
jgi:hypothetical protein